MAHTIKNQAEAAYRRGEQLEKRRQLMQSWADFLEGRSYATAPTLEQGQPQPADQLADLVDALDEDQRQHLLELLTSK